jgi:hypothetical protein
MSYSNQPSTTNINNPPRQSFIHNDTRHEASKQKSSFADDAKKIIEDMEKNPNKYRNAKNDDKKGGKSRKNKKSKKSRKTKNKNRRTLRK